MSVNKMIQIIKDNPDVTEAGIYNQLKGMSYLTSWKVL